MTSEQTHVQAHRRATPANPLLSVLNWELRRMVAAGSLVPPALAIFAVFVAVVLFRHRWGLFGDTVITGTSSFGQLNVLVSNLMLLLGVIVPFVSAGSVARDHRQRVHELLMTTAVPSWAYVWGRWLSALLTAFGIALLLLAAQLTANVLLVSFFGETPAADPALTVYLWSVIALPASITVCGVCGALGAYFPRLSVVTQLLAVAAWVVLALDTDPRDLGWHIYWNPTAAGLNTLLTNNLRVDALATLRPIADPAQRSMLAMQLQNRAPDLTPWLGTFLVLAATAVLLVAFAGLAFRRFRDVLD